MKIVLQDGSKDCGICSLLSIIRFYGGDVSKEYLREVTNTTKDGVSALGLIDGATKLGFYAYGVSGDLKKIDNNNLPCLGHILANKSYKHFVAIYKIDFENEKVITMDPAIGKRTFSFTEYKLLTTNNYIFLKPLKKLPLMNNRKIIKKEIVKYLNNNKLSCIVLGGLTLIYFIFNILVLFHFKYLIYFSVQYNVSFNIYFISLLILVFYISKIMSELFRNIILNKWLFLLDENLTFKVLDQLFHLPYLYFKNRTIGEVFTKVKDLNIIKTYLSKVFCVFSTDFISMIVIGTFLFYINKKLSIIIYSFILVLFFFTLFRNFKKKSILKNINRCDESVNSYLIESLSNVDTIKGCHLEKFLFDKFSLKYKIYLSSSYKYNLFENINLFVKNNFINLLFVIVYGYGSYFVILKSMDITELFLFQTFMTYFINCCFSVFDILIEYSNFILSLSRVEDLFMIKKEKFLGSYYYFGYDMVGSIIFKNLVYKCGSKLLFNKLNLVIDSGQRILLTGASGSGKSTLMKILMRYNYIPYGMCRIKDIDINHYHLENIRSNITYVSNNEYLFTDTLYNNIVLNRDVSDDDFYNVVKLCEIDFIIDDNYKIIVEENGFNFSNGERQRIILARTLLKKSNIYIFDEALSQIDINSEKRILKNIFNYLNGKTIIVISHRFYNKKLFDRVLKIENGVINEEKL